MSREHSPLAQSAFDQYKEYELDQLPEQLQRDSMDYYYLSVYPGLREAPELSPEDLPAMPDKIESAYIHTPFCSGVCDFCSYFLTTVGEDRTPMESYLDVVQQEFVNNANQTELDLSYLYFGGGTPSLIPNQALERFFNFLDQHQVLSETRFGTIELHPEFFKDFDKAQEFVDILKANGVNRVSVGFQSSDEEILGETNRRHGADFLGEALDFLRQNDLLVNLDLMYGLPGMTIEQWEKTLHEAIAHNPDSISTYFLFVSPQTVTHHEVRSGKVTLPSHHEIQVQHIMAQQMLGSLGFHELPSDFYARSSVDPSTFTQDALPSDGASLAVGAGAYGYYDRTQYFNEFNLVRHRQKVLNGESAIWSGYRFEGEEMLHRDIMFSLKNSPYIDRALFIDRHGLDPASKFSETFELLQNHDLIAIDDATMRITLTPKGTLCVEEICCLFQSPKLQGSTVSPKSASDRRTRDKHHFFPTYGQKTNER